MKQKLLGLMTGLLITFVSADAQRIITGVVTGSKDKQPLIGATVIVEKTAIGTTTDLDGKYSLAVPDDAKNLLVSYTGMVTKVVAIDGVVLNVVLSDNEKVLGDVVVTALGIKREKRAIGYSAQEVKGDDLTKAGNPSALSSLSGKVAGMQVRTSSGSPGGAIDIKLRGINSITGENQPLIVVDGVPIDNSQNSTYNNVVNQTVNGNINGDINQNRGIDLNSDDIENISVLKGPAAAALYGSFATNGVIMITTKKGSSTGGKKFNVDISSSITFDQVNKLPKLQNQYTQGSSNEYTPYATRSWGAKGDTMAWDGITTDALDKNGNLVSKNDPTAKTAFKPYDNMNSFFKTGITTSNNISISGGTDQGNFRIAFTNLHQDGIIPLSKLDKNTFTLAGEHKIGKIASISGNASYTNSATSGNLQGNNTSGVMYGVYRTPNSFDNRNGLTGTVKDPSMFIAPDGHQRSYTYYLGRDAYGDNLSIFDNPYWSVNKNPYNSSLNRVIGNVSLSVDPLKWLGFMGRIGTDIYSERNKQVFDKESASTPEGQVIEDHYFSSVVNSDFMANLHKELFKDFNGSLMLGGNVYSSTSQNLNTLGDGLSFGGFYNVSNAGTIISSESKGKTLKYGAYGSLNVDYKSQIYFNFTARNDWSSIHAKGYRSFFYPSLSLSWVFTETAKLSTNKYFPYGKLRLSWAQVGRESPYNYTQGRYYTQQIVADGYTTGVSFPFNGLGGFLNNFNLNNTKLRPEQTTSYEAGLDLRFLQNVKTFGGFGVDFTYYYTLSKDNILQVPVANSTGYSSAFLNSGKIQNMGFEIMGTITPVKLNDFRWDITLNWSKNISKVLALADGTNNVLIGGFDGGSIHAVVGQQYGLIWGGDFMRDSKGNAIVDDRETIGGDKNPGYGLPFSRSDFGLGDTIIGNPNPKWLMGISNSFTWKGLSLSFLFDIKHGGDIYNGTRGALVTYGRAEETVANRENTAYSAGGVKGHPDADGNVVVSGNNDIKVDMTAIGDPTSGKTVAQLWYSDGNGGGFGSASKQFVEDGSFFRLRELKLSYALPASIFKKSILKGIDIAFLARNLFLVTKYKGIDPDQSLAGASNVQGLEWFNLPNTRSYGLSLKLHF